MLKSPYYFGHPFQDTFSFVNKLLKIGLSVSSQFLVFLVSSDLVKSTPIIHSTPMPINGPEKQFYVINSNCPHYSSPLVNLYPLFLYYLISSFLSTECSTFTISTISFLSSHPSSPCFHRWVHTLALWLPLQHNFPCPKVHASKAHEKTSLMAPTISLFQACTYAAGCCWGNHTLGRLAPLQTYSYWSQIVTQCCYQF